MFVNSVVLTNAFILNPTRSAETTTTKYIAPSGGFKLAHSDTNLMNERQKRLDQYFYVEVENQLQDEQRLFTAFNPWKPLA